jgi:beta-lactam-binding protein with PASTA domain
MLMPDLAGLPIRAAAKRLHELGLKVTVTATGRVKHQEPAPGRTVTPGATVVLR